MTKTPDWLTYGEGFVDVKLSRPIEFDGVSVSAVRMREPTVQDQLASDKSQGGNAEKEVALIANLTEIAPLDIGRLPLRDYTRLQKAFTGFID